MVSSGSGEQVQENFFFDAKAIAAGKKRQQREREKMERHFGELQWGVDTSSFNHNKCDTYLCIDYD